MTDTRGANADGKLGNLVPLSHKRVCPHHGTYPFPGPKHLTTRGLRVPFQLSQGGLTTQPLTLALDITNHLSPLLFSRLSLAPLPPNLSPFKTPAGVAQASWDPPLLLPSLTFTPASNPKPKKTKGSRLLSLPPPFLRHCQVWDTGNPPGFLDQHPQ